MTECYILAIDQGTTSTRAFIFNHYGKIIAQSQKDLELFTPHSGWVEQDVHEIWSDVIEVCTQALANIDIEKVIGIGITNQRETTIVWDKLTGEPVYNAIVWQDRRTAEYCKTLKPFEGDIQKKTGLLADPYFSGTKIRWILENVVKDSSSLLFGTVDCYLLWKLTEGKVHATDVTNASRTMLYNIHDLTWDDVQCEILNIPKTMLPIVMDNCAEFGITNLFGKSLPILAMAGDQQAATFGQSCFYEGMIKATYGTGCFALMNTGKKCIASKHNLLSTIAWRIKGEVTYALEGSIFVAGAAIQFLRDNLGFFKKADECEDIANSVDTSGGVVFVPAFTGLGAPYWNPNVRGAIVGLSRGTAIAHITRAVLEAQAFQTRDLIEAMISDSGQQLKTMRVDGGLVNNNTVCQMIADCVSIKIDRPSHTESTIWGVAAMAFLQAGIFADLKDIQDQYRLEKSFIPATKNQYETLYQNWISTINILQQGVKNINE